MLRTAKSFLILLAVTGTLMLHGVSYAASSIDAPMAPPAEPVYEVDAGERPGYIHVNGYWKWTGDNFMWMPSRWLEEREGFVWVADSWAQRGKKWHLNPGHWEVDETGEHAVMPQSVPETTSEMVEEETTSEPVATDSKKAGKAKKIARMKHRGPNYRDTNQWPRVIHH